LIYIKSVNYRNFQQIKQILVRNSAISSCISEASKHADLHTNQRKTRNIVT